MKKTVVQEILYAAKRLTAESFLEWLNDNADDLIETEKQHIVEAWIEGNREGWAMQTDWPEHGVRHYNRIFGTKKTETE